MIMTLLNLLFSEDSLNGVTDLYWATIKHGNCVIYRPVVIERYKLESYNIR